MEHFLQHILWFAGSGIFPEFSVGVILVNQVIIFSRALNHSDCGMNDISEPENRVINSVTSLYNLVIQKNVKGAVTVAPIRANLRQAFFSPGKVDDVFCF